MTAPPKRFGIGSFDYSDLLAERQAKEKRVRDAMAAVLKRVQRAQEEDGEPPPKDR